MNIKNLSINEKSDSVANDFNSRNDDNNFMNKDTMPLDSRIKYENDKADIMRLDTVIKPAYDIERVRKSEYDNSSSSSLSSSDHETPSLSPSGVEHTTSPLSPSGLTRGSRIMNAYASAFRIAQSGRSMVEMLGVLAVIGVLSIGGIMGYSYGMDKYRANETINDVNLRAMDLISQLTQGGTPTLASWEEMGTAGYPISLHTDESTVNHYIKVEKVPFRVCDIISDTLPESVVIEVNNDTEQCADGENVMYFAYAGFDEGTGNNAGPCPAGTSPEGLGGYTGATDSAGNRCYCENADTKWDSATSSCVAQDGSCSSFADCDKGEYCQFSPDNCETTPTSGVCWNLSNCREAGTYNQFWMYRDGERCYPNWWTAQDICNAKGMRLVSLSDVGCADHKEGFCPSDTLSGFKDLYVYFFWTTDLYEENNPNSCNAQVVSYGIRTNSNGDVYVDGESRSNDQRNVLCIQK